MLKNTLIKAATDAAAILKEHFNTSFTISNKEGMNNLVTEVDHKSEEVIFAVIKESFPDHYILSEETGALIQDSSYKWIIDPIDGTVNYANGIPICCVSIGIEKEGKMIMGAVYNPFINEFYFAERGQGAYLNDQRIYVSSKPRILHSNMVTGFPYTYIDQLNGPLEVFSKLVRRGIPVRRLGSAAMDLCWVAAGRFDGFYEHQLSPWDSAAGFILVEEAGGKVTNLKGDYYNPYEHGIIATNGKIHDELVSICNGGDVIED
ncbi:MAG: inositol monophosphatase family protein [Bacteroidota bacterium]